jgi:hypothetical protein
MVCLFLRVLSRVLSWSQTPFSTACGNSKDVRLFQPQLYQDRALVQLGLDNFVMTLRDVLSVIEIEAFTGHW